MNKIIYANCDVCGNKSGFDKKSLKASTHTINGLDIILCVPCEDDLFLTLLKNRMPEEKMKELTERLMSFEKEEILDLYYDHNSFEDD